MLRESQDLHKLFDYLRFLVLDEVDRLLDPMTDYGNDLKFILQCVTKSKDLQIGLFSATIKTILDEHNKPQKNLPVTLKNPAICIVGNTEYYFLTFFYLFGLFMKLFKRLLISLFAYCFPFLSFFLSLLLYRTALTQSKNAFKNTLLFLLK